MSTQYTISTYYYLVVENLSYKLFTMFCSYLYVFSMFEHDNEDRENWCSGNFNYGVHVQKKQSVNWKFLDSSLLYYDIYNKKGWYDIWLKNFDKDKLSY